jgi:hypothetical protein
MIQETGGLKSAGRSGLFEDFLLSLNLGVSLLSAGLIFVLKSAGSLSNINDSLYLGLRSVYRVSDFLRFAPVNPVSTNAVRREMPGSAEQLGAEIAVLITGLAAMAFVLLILRLLCRAQGCRQSLDFVRLPVLLFAGPVFFLLISFFTWNWAAWMQLDIHGSFFRNSPPFLFFVVEFLCASATILRPNRQSATWAIAVFAIFHWAFWGYCLWNESHAWLFPIYAQDLMLILLPASTLLWLWRERPSAHSLAEGMYRHRKVLYTLCGVGAVLAVVLWHPARNVDMSHPRNWKTVEVEVSRGPCYGSCGVYTATVRGDGQVEFVGQERHPQIETRKSGRIGQEKILEILRDLDRIEFTTLDGRAFRWAFDTPSIGVRASVDGKTKVVVSDSFNERSSVGRQTRFLAAAEEIDTILSSTVWTQCEGNCGGSGAKR